MHMLVPVDSKNEWEHAMYIYTYVYMYMSVALQSSYFPFFSCPDHPGFLFCAQVAGVLAMIAVALVVCVCFIALADLQGNKSVVLEGRSAGGELEDERAVSAAINMAVKTHQTDLLTFPAEFNATLADLGPYVDETDTASDEGKAMQEINAQYAAGTDPW